jgi:hypothetical protein
MVVGSGDFKEFAVHDGRRQAEQPRVSHQLNDHGQAEGFHKSALMFPFSWIGIRLALDPPQVHRSTTREQRKTATISRSGISALR